jgi:hypothetical protein
VPNGKVEGWGQFRSEGLPRFTCLGTYDNDNEFHLRVFLICESSVISVSCGERYFISGNKVAEGEYSRMLEC